MYTSSLFNNRRGSNVTRARSLTRWLYRAGCSLLCSWSKYRSRCWLRPSQFKTRQPQVKHASLTRLTNFQVAHKSSCVLQQGLHRRQSEGHEIRRGWKLSYHNSLPRACESIKFSGGTHTRILSIFWRATRAWSSSTWRQTTAKSALFLWNSTTLTSSGSMGFRNESRSHQLYEHYCGCTSSNLKQKYSNWLVWVRLKW